MSIGARIAILETLYKSSDASRRALVLNFKIPPHTKKLGNSIWQERGVWQKKQKKKRRRPYMGTRWDAYAHTHNHVLHAVYRRIYINTRLLVRYCSGRVFLYLKMENNNNKKKNTVSLPNLLCLGVGLRKEGISPKRISGFISTRKQNAYSSSLSLSSPVHAATLFGRSQSGWDELRARNDKWPGAVSCAAPNHRRLSIYVT